MAKISKGDISNMQFNKEKPFLLDQYNDVRSARTQLYIWKMENKGCSFKTRLEQLEEKFILYITLLNND